jgi:hypothetical protein
MQVSYTSTTKISAAKMITKKILLKATCLIALVVGLTVQASAQAIGDYRSTVAVFNWTATGNWERWDGSTWVLNPAQGYPGQNVGTGVVTIRDGATVTINVTPAQPIGGLTVGEGVSGNLFFDNTSGRVLTVGAAGVLVSVGGTFNATGPIQDGGNDTYTLTIQNDGAFTNNGSIAFRRPDGPNVDLLNVNLSGNLAGTGSSTFNNIIFNGTNNQTISISGTVAITGTGGGTITFNNTGAVPNNQITNQSVAFTNAISATPGRTTFTAGNYRHDVSATYNVSLGDVTFGAGGTMTVTVLQGTMNFATGDDVQLDLNGGDLIVDGPTAVVNVGGGETTNRQKLLTSGTTADITVQNGGTLIVGNNIFGDIRFDGGAGTMLVTGSGTVCETGRIVTGNTAGNGGTLSVTNNAIMRVSRNRTSFVGGSETVIFFRGTSTINVNSGAQLFLGSPTDSAGNISADQDNAFVRTMTVDGSGTAVRVYGRWLGSGGASAVNTTYNIQNNASWTVGENLTAVAIAGDNSNTGCATININSGASVRFYENVTSVNNINLCIIGNANGGGMNIIDGTFELLGNTNMTSVLFAGGNSAMSIAGTVTIGDGVGADSTARLLIGRFTLSELPTPAQRNFLDVEPFGQVTINSDGNVTVGGGNRGNMRLISNAAGDAGDVTINGGRLNVRAQLSLGFGGGGGGSDFIVNNGVVNIGIGASNGANTIQFPADPIRRVRFILNGGTVNVGDGNSAMNVGAAVGGSNNLPAYGSGAFQELQVNGGFFNMFGRFNLNDGNARFIQTGGAFTINQGEQDPGGAEDILAFRRGIVYQTGGSIRLVDPNPTGGTGVTVRVNDVGNPGTTAAAITGDTSNYAVPTGVTFLGTFGFGDGVSTASGSPDGFDMLLSTNHNFASFEINNPGGINRFVTLGLIGGPGAFDIAGDMNLLAGEFRQATNTITVSGNLFVGASGIYRISNTSGTPFPTVLTTLNLVHPGSTVIFDGNGDLNVTTAGANFSNLVISGTGTKTLTVTRSVLGTLTLDNGTFNTFSSLQRLTMGSNSTIRLNNGVLSATSTIQGSNHYTVEYVGTSKTMGDREFSGAGPLKTLVGNLNSGQTLTLNANRNVRNLTIDTCFFNTNNFSLGVDSNITLNSGEHIGLGRIILQTSTVHTISGDNNGILKALRITGPASTVNVNMTANTTIKDSISFSTSSNDRFFNVTGSRVLTFDTSGTAIGISAASPRRFIATNGLVSQGGVAKVFPGLGSFSYPISGATTKYTPATITVNTGSPGGIITVRPINSRIPFAAGGTDSLLQYYWRVDRTGFTTNVNATLSFTYDQADVSVPAVENLYVPALYNPAAFTTFSETQVDETNNIISFTGLNLLAGQYTAGHPNRFGTVEALYSVANGSWFDPNTWSLTPTGTPGNGGTPNNSKPIFVQGARTVTVPVNGASAASLDIASINDAVEIGDGTTGHDLGELSGFGTLRLISNTTATPTFPTAIYATFLSEDGGTVGFGGTGSYTVPTTPTAGGEYRNIAVSGSGTKTFANENVLLYGSLRILSGVAQFSSTTNGNMTIDSIITVSSGATLRFQGTGTERSIIVGRAIANNGNFIVDNSLTLNHALQLGGNLVNNGTLDFRNANTNCNITFSGANNATLSGTGSTTEFNRLIVNKGTDTSRVLQVTASNFSLASTTPTGNKALTLTNGTFRMSGTASTTITLNSDNEDFTIPSSARLWIDNPNAQAVVTTAGNDKLVLQGILQVSQGQINVGNTDDGGVNQMRILYEGTTSAIIVSGGELNVAERIRQNSASSTLRYNQSGGIVRVARFKSDIASVNTTDEADFNMPIAGGSFTMSGGTLEVVRRNMGAAGAGGIAIRINATTTANVTGGTVHVLTANASGSSGTAISSGVPFYNLILGNGTVAYDVGSPDATPQTLRVLNDLTVNLGTTGQLRLYRVRTGGAGDDNINLTVGGNLNIATGSLVFGTLATATLTLDGAGAGTEQLISNTGSAASITVRNFTINSAGKPVRLGTTSGADLVVQNNFTLLSGTLDAATNSRRVTFSTATNINQNLAIPVTGITFYDLRINKTTVNNQVIVAGGNITVTNTLDLQDGVLNLGVNGLNLTSPTSGAITGGTFGADRRILLGGTVSDLGVTRAYPNTTTTGFIFPIGTGSLYTPATVNVTTADGIGSVTVKPISTRFPSAPAGSSLEYYWDVSVQGFGAGVQTAHTFGYAGVTLSGSEANYRGNFFNGLTWAVVPQPTDDDVDETNDLFGAQINAASILNNVVGTFANRAFTAGFNFVNPVIFYSWAGGVVGGTMNWASGTNNAATSPWSSDPTVFNPSGVDGVEPTAANPVIIQNNHTVNITVNGRTASSVTLNAGTTLNLAATTGHNFGAGISGQGTLRTESATLPTLASAFRNIGGGTINFAGGTYNINGPQTFNNLTVSAGTKTIASGNLTINGDLSVTSGTLNLATFSANRSSVGGSLSLSAGAVLVLQGVSNFPANYTTYSLAPTSIVRYDGNANQTISSLGGQPYGILEVLITGTATTYTKTLAGATEVAGNLTINRTGGTGNLILATNNHNLTVGGNFSLSQADPITQFNGGTSTVTFNGAGAQTITRVGGGTLTFNNLTVNKTSGTLTLATATATTTLTVPGTLSLASGALTIGGSVSVPNTLALNGTASGAGTITGSTNSNLSIGGTANAAVGTIGFTTGAQTLRDLTINKGTTNAAEVTFGSDLAVANLLTLTNGRVLMSGTNTLTYNNTSSSIAGGNANSFIDGRLAIQFPTTGVTRVFPTGDVLNFRPVRVTTASATAGSTVRTEMINTIPTSGSLGGMNNISGVRYYSVDLTAGSLTSPQVRLEYQPDEVVTDPNDLVVARSTDNNNWTNIGRDAANSSTSTPTGFITSNVTTIGSTTFFALGSLTSDNPLPVNMLSVNAVAKNGRTAVIQWETASEQDNLGFVIYRSETENGNFEQIASYQTADKLRGQGTRLENTKYLYEDSRNTLPGKEYFYKLVSVDIDGTRHDITLSGQRIWSVQLPFEYALDQNYPNPFNPVTTIQFSLEKTARTTLEIYNVLGQKVATLVNGELNAGAYRYQWNGSGMASGIYFYRLRSDNFVATKKMLLVK